MPTRNSLELTKKGEATGELSGRQRKGGLYFSGWCKTGVLAAAGDLCPTYLPGRQCRGSLLTNSRPRHCLLLLRVGCEPQAPGLHSRGWRPATWDLPWLLPFLCNRSRALGRSRSAQESHCTQGCLDHIPKVHPTCSTVTVHVDLVRACSFTAFHCLKTDTWEIPEI